MADIQLELDGIAEQMAKKHSVAKAEVVASLMVIVKGRSPEEASAIISQLNIDEMMKLKMAGAFALFDQAVIRILESTFSPSASVLSEATLRSLLDNAKGFISAEFVGKTSAIMKQSIIDGISVGKFPSDVVKELNEVFRLDERHLQTIVNTGYSQYSNAITNMMSSGLPDNTKYVYIGAYDGKTRDRCIEKIQFSPASKKSVLGRFGDLNNEIWNCRHKWEPASRDIEGQGFEDKASA